MKNIYDWVNILYTESLALYSSPVRLCHTRLFFECDIGTLYVEKLIMQ